jgi:hypothetical protein
MPIWRKQEPHKSPVASNNVHPFGTFQYLGGARSA